jgi:hypothetical protein
VTDETRDLTPTPFVPYVAGPPEPPQEYTLYTAPEVTEPVRPAPRPGHPTWVVPAVIILTLGLMAAAVAVVALVALSPDPIPATSMPAAAPGSVATTSAPGVAPVDSFAVRACDLIAPLANADSAQDPAQLEELGNLAAMSQDPAIALEGRRLALSAEMARHAVGADDEELVKLDLFTSTLKMATACIEGGYVTRR